MSQDLLRFLPGGQGGTWGVGERRGRPWQNPRVVQEAGVTGRQGTQRTLAGASVPDPGSLPDSQPAALPAIAPCSGRPSAHSHFGSVSWNQI